MFSAPPVKCLPVRVCPHPPFAMAIFWGPFLRACRKILISTPVQVISVSVSNGSVNSLSTCKIKSILLLTLGVAADSSRCN